VTTASARRPVGRPAVPLDRVLDAALRIVDEEGAGALSMRTLAHRLDSSTATIYRNFAGRPDLIARVVDRVFGELELEPERFSSMGWREACSSMAHEAFAVLRRHGNVTQLLAEQVPTGPNAMILRERILAVLLNGGLPPFLAARAYATLARFVLGCALQPASREAVRENEKAAAAEFQNVSAATFPATLLVANCLPIPVEDEFAFGLDLLLDGLENAARPD
jgi:AcrR family transcriptional regulator